MKKNKLWSIILIIISALLMTGCENEKMVADNPLSEDEIIKYAQERIYEETGDEVTVEIVSKKQMQVPIMWIDGPIGYEDVEGGHEYELKITSVKNKNIVSTGYYQDGYITYDEDTNTQKYVHEEYFGSQYAGAKGFNRVKTEFIYALDSRFDEYYFYEENDVHGELYVFICSADYDLINDLLLSFRDTVENLRNQKYVGYSVYIFKDKEVFDDIDFDSYMDCKQSLGSLSFEEDILSKMTGKQVIDVANCDDSFDREFFESNGASNTYRVFADTNPKSYEYMFFCYNAEPNSFVGANSPDFNIYGVKDENFVGASDNNEEQDEFDGDFEEGSPEYLFEQFLSGEIDAEILYPIETDEKTKINVSKLNMNQEEWSFDSFSVGEQLDLDNDGENELILDGPYGGMYLDAIDGNLYVFAKAFGNAGALDYTFYDGAYWIVIKDTTHGGRLYYLLYKYEGGDNLVDEMSLLGTWYSEDEKEFTFNDEQITEEEFNKIQDELFASKVPASQSSYYE